MRLTKFPKEFRSISLKNTIRFWLNDLWYTCTDTNVFLWVYACHSYTQHKSAKTVHIYAYTTTTYLPALCHTGFQNSNKGKFKKHAFDCKIFRIMKISNLLKVALDKAPKPISVDFTMKNNLVTNYLYNYTTDMYKFN